MRWFVTPIVCVVLAGCGATPPAGGSGPKEPVGPTATGEQGSSPEGTPAEGTPKDPDTLPLSGTLTDEQIQAAVNENVKAFDSCYTLGADKDGKLAGTVTLQATVGPLGVVNEASVKKSTVGNPKVDDCVRKAFKTIKFPRPAGGGTVMITYPMTFGGEVVIKK
ncbi:MULTISPECIES: AgmX/PglI C-terminal domain-containing protein [Polyangium]|uniref:Energy transducer TonB n=2 Tax=Polyangium TaxID=55 RepID=A0A4U1J640_9BACT|nr:MULTISPECIES: AgmX/PglI C-terminal domain-containing protein [Polyangium]MDI1435404.1 AgmX/PglI C-terminal domain-containing protein [Polyangium sorediatum]TKD02703.1 energy transducer TonB [Polyangium fumosum]